MLEGTHPGTPFRQPHSKQRRPARAHAVGPVLGPHARTDRIRDTRVAEPRLPAPGDGRPGEGQRLTPDAPHNGGRLPTPGTAPHSPRGMQPPQGMQAKGTVLSPHTHTPAPTAPGWRTPTARPVGGQSGEGQRLTSDAPHNGGRHPPRGRPSAGPTASNAGPRGRTLWGRCWVPRPASTAPGTHGSRVPWQPASEDGRPGEGQRLTPDAPHNGGRHHPRGRPSATPTASNAGPQGRTLWGWCWVPMPAQDLGRDTRVAEPWLPAPEDGRPGEGQRLTPDALHNGGRPPPPGTAPPPPPRHAAPTGHAGQGDSVGPPHPHTRAHSTWVPDPNSPRSGRAVGGGTAPDLRRPSQWWKAPPPGTPFRRPHSKQRRPARAHAVGPVLGPHARIDRTRDTRVTEPWQPASEDGRPGEGQRLTPDAPHNG